MWGVSGESSPFCLPPSSTEPLFASSWLLHVGRFSEGWDEPPKYTCRLPHNSEGPVCRAARLAPGAGG